MTSAPIVYLAGPAALLAGAKPIFKYLKEVCAENGLEGLAPIDGLPDLAGLAPADKAAALRRANIEKLRACDLVVACISPFRGPDCDPGTAWEIGYAEALGKPVVTWCEEITDYLSRVPHTRDDDGRVWCQQHGMQVEDYGLVDSLMLAAGPVPVQPDFGAAVRLAKTVWENRALARNAGET